MKRAAVALRSLAAAIGAAVGLEGAFLLIGTCVLSVGASFLHPAGPWIVTGIVLLLAGMALTMPRRID